MIPIYGYIGELFEPSSASERQSIVERSGIRHARFGNFASCLGVVAARDILDRLPESVSARLGIVVSGGPLHLDTAWEFCEQYVRNGPRLVNPLQFAHTIFSAPATAIAAALGAHSFALSAGSGVGAGIEALRVGLSLTRAEHATCTCVIALCSGGVRVRQCQRELRGQEQARDAAFALGLSSVPVPGWDFELFGISIDRAATAEMSGAIWADDETQEDLPVLEDRYGGAAILIALRDAMITRKVASKGSARFRIGAIEIATGSSFPVLTR